MIDSLACSLLELEDVAETSERAQLLWHRLEARRDAGVRTTRETQDAIQDVAVEAVTLRSVGEITSAWETLPAVQASDALMHPVAVRDACTQHISRTSVPHPVFSSESSQLLCWRCNTVRSND